MAKLEVNNEVTNEVIKIKKKKQQPKQDIVLEKWDLKERINTSQNMLSYAQPWSLLDKSQNDNISFSSLISKVPKTNRQNEFYDHEHSESGINLLLNTKTKNLVDPSTDDVNITIKLFHQEKISQYRQLFQTEFELPQSIGVLIDNSVLTSIQKHGRFKDFQKDYTGRLNKTKYLEDLCLIASLHHVSYYYGQVSTSGQKEGYGKLLMANKDFYEGYFVQNQMHGFGNLYCASGVFKSGKWEAGEQHGESTWIVPNVSVYRGDWNMGEKCGFGEEIFVSEEKYTGEFLNNLRHGKGEIYFPNGWSFEGYFVKGLIEGKGIFKYSNKKSYSGDWEKGKMHGEGEFIWPDGRRYVGSFYENLKDGFGVYYLPNGVRYEGSFEEGKPYGPGKLFYPNGTIEQKIWDYDNNTLDLKKMGRQKKN